MRLQAALRESWAFSAWRGLKKTRDQDANFIPVLRGSKTWRSMRTKA